MSASSGVEAWNRFVETASIDSAALDSGVAALDAGSAAEQAAGLAHRAFRIGLSSLLVGAEEVGRWALARYGRAQFFPPFAWGVFAAGLVTLSLMVPDAWRALVWARKSGGRFNEKGLIIHPDLDKSAVFRALSREPLALAFDALR